MTDLASQSLCSSRYFSWLSKSHAVIRTSIARSSLPISTASSFPTPFVNSSARQLLGCTNPSFVVLLSNFMLRMKHAARGLPMSVLVYTPSVAATSFSVTSAPCGSSTTRISPMPDLRRSRAISTPTAFKPRIATTDFAARSVPASPSAYRKDASSGVSLSKSRSRGVTEGDAILAAAPERVLIQ